MVDDVLSADYRERWLKVAPAITQYYRVFGPEAGGATPVVCLPGYWRNSRDFEHLASHLAPRRRVLTPDLRGRGRTDRSEDVADYAFERLIEDVLLLLRQEKVERAVFCGTALGGQLSLVLAAERPELVAGVILNDTGLEPASAAATQRMVRFAGADEHSFDELVERTREQYAEQFPSFGDADWRRMALRAHRQLESGKWVRDFDQRTNQVFADIKAAHPTWWPEYRTASAVPMAILRGEHSAYLTPDVAERMVAEHPKATLYTIHGSGHAPTLWEPEAFAAVDDFLEQIDR